MPYCTGKNIKLLGYRFVDQTKFGTKSYYIQGDKSFLNETYLFVR